MCRKQADNVIVRRFANKCLPGDTFKELINVSPAYSGAGLFQDYGDPGFLYAFDRCSLGMQVIKNLLNCGFTECTVFARFNLNPDIIVGEFNDAIL